MPFFKLSITKNIASNIYELVNHNKVALRQYLRMLTAPNDNTLRIFDPDCDGYSAIWLAETCGLLSRNLRKVTVHDYRQCFEGLGNNYDKYVFLDCCPTDDQITYLKSLQFEGKTPQIFVIDEHHRNYTLNDFVFLLGPAKTNPQECNASSTLFVMMLLLIYNPQQEHVNDLITFTYLVTKNDSWRYPVPVECQKWFDAVRYKLKFFPSEFLEDVQNHGLKIALENAQEHHKQIDQELNDWSVEMAEELLSAQPENLNVMCIDLDTIRMPEGIKPHEVKSLLHRKITGEPFRFQGVLFWASLTEKDLHFMLTRSSDQYAPDDGPKSLPAMAAHVAEQHKECSNHGHAGGRSFAAGFIINVDKCDIEEPKPFFSMS